MTATPAQNPARFEELSALLAELDGESPRRDELREGIARWLADAVPEPELQGVATALLAEQSRRRSAVHDRLLDEARVRAGAGDLHGARDLAREACRLDPCRWEAHRFLAGILEELGDVDGCRLQFAWAFHLGWDSEEAIATIRRAWCGPNAPAPGS